jgi:hypothetical protein
MKETLLMIIAQPENMGRKQHILGKTCWCFNMVLEEEGIQ